MDRRAFVTGLGVVLAAPLVEAQQAGNAWRIGYLRFGLRPADRSNLASDPLLQGLHDLGYVEGRNLILEIRYAEGRTDRFSGLAAELAGLKLDALVVESTPAALAAKQATNTIPIVMLVVSDPVGVKLVESLAHPGGNVTGLSILAPQLSAKRLDLLKQTVPNVSRVAVLWNSANQGMRLRFQETMAAAPNLGVTLKSVTVQTPEDFDTVLPAIITERPDSLLVLADTVTSANSSRIVEFAARHRLPTIYEAKNFVAAGGLLSYGVDVADHYRRGASYIDRILKGAKPADLPIEQPTKFELVINLKTAKALGLSIPPSLLLRADQVIEE